MKMLDVSSQQKQILKIIVAGNSGVGKTTLLKRYIEGKFIQSSELTVGVEHFVKEACYLTSLYKMQLWDLGGQESFRSLRKLYLEGANGALVIYDCTKRSSFEKLEDWILDFKDARGDEPLILIGNKTDLTDAIKVQESEGIELAKEYNMEFILTSAKTGSNVEKAFKEIIKIILDKSLDS